MVSRFLDALLFPSSKFCSLGMSMQVVRVERYVCTLSFKVTPKSCSFTASFSLPKELVYNEATAEYVGSLFRKFEKVNRYLSSSLVL